jgi:hypothetical protein
MLWADYASQHMPTYTMNMKECNAPESNNTTAEVSLMKNIPLTTSGAS